MTEDFSYSDLRKIEKKERDKERFVDVDEDLVQKASRLIKRKRESGKEQEYRNTRRLFRKLMETRRRKILSNARMSTKSNINISELNLLPGEKDLLVSVKNQVEENKERVERLIEEQHSPEQTPPSSPPVDQETEVETSQTESEEGYKTIHAVKQIPEFMGTDLESYGPFEKGENAEIPEENAEILINKGTAEAQ